MKKINEMTAREQDQLFKRLIKKELQKSKLNGWPIAKYDAKLKFAYREYPDGTMKCLIDGYDAEISPNKDKGGFIVSFPDFPDCMTFADTLESALTNGKDALNTSLDAVDDEILLALATERVENNDPSKNISQEKFNREFDIKPEDFENTDDIEIE